MKRAISLLITFIMVISLFPFAALADGENNESPEPTAIVQTATPELTAMSNETPTPNPTVSPESLPTEVLPSESPSVEALFLHFLGCDLVDADGTGHTDVLCKAEEALDLEVKAESNGELNYRWQVFDQNSDKDDPYVDINIDDEPTADEKVLTVRTETSVFDVKDYYRCIVTAKSGEETLVASCYFTLKDESKEQAGYIPVESITISMVRQGEVSTLDNAGNTLPVGGTLQLKATVYPENATNKDVVWSSSDETIASVNEMGLVTAVKIGYVTIIAVAQDDRLASGEIKLTTVDTLALPSAIDPSTMLTTTAIVLKGTYREKLNQLAAIQDSGTKYYWNAGRTSGQLISDIKNGNFTSCLTRTQCIDHKYYHGVIPNCTSNTFDGREQCNGYAHYIAYALTGKFIPGLACKTGEIITKKFDNGWTKTTWDGKAKELDFNSFVFEPGDVVCYNNGNSFGGLHYVVIWYVSDNNIYVAHANGRGRCGIAFEQLNPSELSAMKNNLRWVAKAPGNTSSPGLNIKFINISGDLHGGTLIINPFPFKMAVGAQFKPLNSPYKTGYSFVGWYTEETSGKIVTADTQAPEQANLTLHARWKANTYTLKFNPNGGTCDKTSQSVDYGSGYGDLPTPQRSGYIFDGWYTSVSSTDRIQSVNLYTTLGDQTLYAHWTVIKKFTVTFDANGGVCYLSSKTVTEGSPYGTLPIPVNAGSSFLGWFTSISGETPVTSESALSQQSNHTLYARWTKLSVSKFTGSSASVNGPDGPVITTVLSAGTYGTISSYGFSIGTSSSGAKSSCTVANGQSLFDTTKNLTIKVNSYYSELKMGTTYFYTLWAKDSSGKILTETTVASFTTDTCSHGTYNADGTCTKCGALYNWEASRVNAPVTLYPSSGKTSIALKDRPYGVGTVLVDSLDFVSAAGYVVNHLGHRWYEVIWNNRSMYVYSGNVTNHVNVTDVSLQIRNANIPVGYSFDTAVFVVPTNAANRAVIWSTSNSNVATVSDGHITAVGAGTAVVSATSVDNNSKIGTCNVTVYSPNTTTEPDKLFLDAANITLTIQDTYSLSANFSPCDPQNKTITWTSSNPSVATVTNGFIQPLATGSTVITATSVAYPSLSDSCLVYVDLIHVDSVSIHAAGNATQIREGETLQFTATILPSNAYFHNIVWSIEENGVQGSSHATISDNGLLTALSPGTLKVLANYAGGASEYELTIVAGDGTAERELREYIDESPTTGGNYYSIEDDLTLKSDLVIPTGFVLDVCAGATLSVPSGVTLTNNGEISVGDASLLSSLIFTGNLINNGTISVVNNGYLESCKGAFSGNSVDLYKATSAKIVGDVPINKIYGYAEESFRNAIENCGVGSSVLCSSLTLTDDLIIPAGVTVLLTEGTILLNENCTLTVNGQLKILSNHNLGTAKLVLSGSLVNNGNILVDGISSSIELGSTGSFQGGEVLLDNGGSASSGILARQAKILVETITTDKVEIEGYAGESYVIKSTIEPANAANQTLTWQSSNENVAIAYWDGSILLVGNGGTATVTATANDGSGIYATIQVTTLACPYLAKGTCGAQGDNISWTLYKNGLLSFTGSGDMLDYNSLNYYPQWTNSYYRNDVLRVELEEGITNIGGSAFRSCAELESVSIPESVTVIQSGAFAYCTNLESIRLPDGLKVIDANAFQNCTALHSVSIPNGVETIGRSAFTDCSGMISISIPTTVISLGETAFQRCTALDNITILSEQTAINRYAFSECNNLVSVSLPEGMKKISEGMFAFCVTLKSITIPESVKAIENRAFAWSGLKTIQIPASVVDIAEQTFWGCNDLTDIYFNGTQEEWRALSVEVPSGVIIHTDEPINPATNIVQTEAELRETLSSLSDYTEISIAANANISLSADITLPANVKLTLYNGTLSIPAGITLTNEGEIASQSTSTIQIDGTLENNGLAMLNYFGLVRSGNLKDNTGGVNTFIDVTNANELVAALATNADIINIRNNILATRSITISDGIELNILEGFKLTVSSGYSLTNNGTVSVYGTLMVNGTYSGNRARVYSGGSIIPLTIPHFSEGQRVTTISLNGQTLVPTCMETRYSVQISPGDAWNDQATFSIVAGDELASIDEQSGVLVSYNIPGEITIRAQANDESGVYSDISVEIVECSLNIYGASTLISGKATNLSASFSPSNVTKTTIAWSLADGDSAYASVSASGLVTAKMVTEPHTVTIIASAVDGAADAAQKEITIYPVLSSIQIQQDSKNVTGSTILLNNINGTTLSFDCAMIPSDAMPDITWSMSATTAATLEVSNEGKSAIISPIAGKSGKVTLTAKANDGSGKTAVVYIQVAAISNGVTVSDSKNGVLYAGKSTQLVATFADPQPTSTAVKWVLSPEYDAFASLSSTGLFTAKAVTEEVVVKVVAVPADGGPQSDSYEVAIKPLTNSLQLLRGDTYVTNTTQLVDIGHEDSMILTAVVWPYSASQDIAFSSNMPSIATVSETGEVKALKTGLVTITAKTTDGSGKTASVKLNIVSLPQAIEAASPMLALRGGTSGTYRVKDFNTGVPIATNLVRWTLDDGYASIAAITTGGVLTTYTVNKPEEVLLHAEIIGNEEIANTSFKVTVYPATQSIKLYNDTLTLTGPVVFDTYTMPYGGGSEMTLTAKTIPANAMQEMTWSSSNKTIAIVENGVVKPVWNTVTGAYNKGVATITARAKDGTNLSVSTMVQVVSLAQSIKLSTVGSATQLISGTSLQLKVTLGNPAATNPKVYYSIVSGAEYATVSTSGLVTAKTAYSDQLIVVKATAADGSGEDTKELTVTPKEADPLVIQSIDGSVTLNGTRQSFDITSGAASVKLAAVGFKTCNPVNVKWSVSPSTIGKVSIISGVATLQSLKAGVVTVTATDAKGRTASFTAEFYKPAASLSINPPKGMDVENLKLSSGKAMQLMGVIAPSTGVTTAGVNWYIGVELEGEVKYFKDTNLASISSTGLVTAKAGLTTPNTVTIWAVTKNAPYLTDSVTITITPAATGLDILLDGAISNNLTQMLDLGTKTAKLTASVYPDSANQSVNWTSSDKLVATVASDGTVTALKAGTVTITAMADGKSATMKLVVSVRMTALEIKSAIGFAMRAGGTLQLSAAFTPTYATDKRVSWTLLGDGAQFATVSSTGLITAKASTRQQKIDVLATSLGDKSITSTQEIMIYPATTKVQILDAEENDVTGKTLMLDLNEKTGMTLLARNLPSMDGGALQSVIWKSSNTAVLRVEADGTLTPVKKSGSELYYTGTVTITATASDGSGKYASVTVFVGYLVTGITFADGLTVKGGYMLTLKPTFEPVIATNKAVRWTIKASDTPYATISSTGVLTAKKLTETRDITIYCEALDGSGVVTEVNVLITV